MLQVLHSSQGLQAAEPHVSLLLSVLLQALDPGQPALRRACLQVLLCRQTAVARILSDCNLRYPGHAQGACQAPASQVPGHSPWLSCAAS